MKIKVAYVSQPGKMEVLRDILPFIDKMARRTLGRQGPEDIIMQLMQPSNQLWLLYDLDENATIVGYILSRIELHPKAKHMVLVNCGGAGDLIGDNFKSVWGVLEGFARENNCDGIEFLGRLGWKRAMRQLGCSMPQAQYYKSLRGDHE